MTHTACYFAGDDQPRLVRSEHVLANNETGLKTCPGDTCRGCVECPEDHCTVCTVEHCDDQHPLTCLGCVSSLRDDLRQIVRMSRELADHAVLAGAGRLAAASIPGGEATVMRGPAKSPHGRSWYAERKLNADHLEERHDGDHDTPGMVLGQIEDDWRELLGEPTTTRKSAVSALAYIGQNLSRMSQRDAGDFPSNATAISALRHFLEEILHDGERHDPGAPCVHCGTSLVRKSATPKRLTCRHARLAIEAALHFGEPAFRLKDLLRVDAPWARAMATEHESCTTRDQGGRRDGWECLRCRRRYTEEQYRFAVGAGYLLRAPALTAADLERKLGVPASQVRVWGSRKLVAKRGKDENGHWRYDVAQVEQRLEEIAEQERARQAAVRAAAEAKKEATQQQSATSAA